MIPALRVIPENCPYQKAAESFFQYLGFVTATATLWAFAIQLKSWSIGFLAVCAFVAVALWTFIGVLRFTATVSNQHLPSNKELYRRARHFTFSMIIVAAVGAVTYQGTQEVVGVLAKIELKVLAASLPGSK